MNERDRRELEKTLAILDQHAYLFAVRLERALEAPALPPDEELEVEDIVESLYHSIDLTFAEDSFVRACAAMVWLSIIDEKTEVDRYGKRTRFR